MGFERQVLFGHCHLAWKVPSNYVFVSGITAQMGQISGLFLNGNNAVRHSINRCISIDLKSAQNLVLWEIGHFIPSTKFKIGLWCSPLVKLTQSLTKVIHVAKLEDSSKVGPKKENSMCILKQNWLMNLMAIFSFTQFQMLTMIYH